MAVKTESVYVIRAKGTNRYKIGFSTDIGSRIASMQTGSPFPLELIHEFEGTLSNEKAVHKMLASYRLHGEWFELTESALSFVMSLDSQLLSRIDVARYMLENESRLKHVYNDAGSDWDECKGVAVELLDSLGLGTKLVHDSGAV